MPGNTTMRRRCELAAVYSRAGTRPCRVGTVISATVTRSDRTGTSRRAHPLVPAMSSNIAALVTSGHAHQMASAHATIAPIASRRHRFRGVRIPAIIVGAS
jgi:hypothetical protein